MIALLDADCDGARDRHYQRPGVYFLTCSYYILKIWKHSWGCNLVVGIGTRQLFSLPRGAVGARGGWDRNPA
eukprot:1840144-Pleurochrysis_carterae.AAC.1